MAAFETLIRENPDLQVWGDGTPANWAVAPEVLRFIGAHVRPGMQTLETGAGQPTIAFAIAGARHTAITLDRGEAERVRSWCARNGVPLDNLAFIHENSDQALSRGDGIPEALDFVFIDGAHRFPFPCLGLSGVDDFAMPSVRILFDFLRAEDEWTLVETIARTAFFRRDRETVVVNDCQGQRINQMPY